MKTLLFILSSVSLCAQMHSNKPLPEFSEDPVHVLHKEDLTGWSYSKDGQWISEEGVIPIRAISTDKEKYEADENELGLDNIKELQMYSVLYGADTLLALVKIYEQGMYEMPAIQRSWKTSQDGYFFLFDKKELDKLKDISEAVRVLKLELRDYGSISDVSTRKVRKKLQKSVIIKPATERQLMVTAKRENDRIFFQLASMHKTFAGVEGILQDVTREGQSLYGRPKLLDYVHYECGAEEFHRFFSFPEEIVAIQ